MKKILFLLLLSFLIIGFIPVKTQAATTTESSQDTNLDINFNGRYSDVAKVDSYGSEKEKATEVYNLIMERLTIIAGVIFGVSLVIIITLGKINASRISMSSSYPQSRKNAITQFMLCMVALAILGGAGTLAGLLYMMFR